MSTSTSRFIGPRPAPPGATRIVITETSLPGALLRPGAWPAGAGDVELVETHISWVFLVGECAYKVKKPVRLDFLDFSTQALRRHFCEEELRLNRRFAPQLYLGLSTVVATPTGLAVDQQGEVVDHAVRMHRFDRSQELDALLGRGAATPALLERFGAKLSLQQDAAPVAGPAQDWASPARALQACRENFAELRRDLHDDLLARAEALSAWTESRFRQLQPRLQRRRDRGRFRECHGDLHCANVVRHGDELWAFDALEFDPALHWIDLASDLAFLSMDLQARGHPVLRAALLDGWLGAGGDFDALGVLRFHEAYRASVRAKVAAIRLRQVAADASALLRELERYLSAAEWAARSSRPMLLAMTGLSGSGKSWLAERLLGPLDAVRLRSDVERKRLAGLPPGARSGGSIYTRQMNQLTYERLQVLASAALADGWRVIVDAASLRRSERDAFARLARDAGVPFCLIETRAEAGLLRSRVAARATAGTDPSEATPRVLEDQFHLAEPLDADERLQALVVDTGGEVDVDALAQQLLQLCLSSTAAAAPPAGSPGDAAPAS